MAELLPPPTYSQQDPGVPTHFQALQELSFDPQILLIPTVNAVNFQKGYLGAEGERAAIEGELQVKGIDPERWTRVAISLRSFERAYLHEIELAYTEIELYTRTEARDAFPSSFPFAIPLMPDTPQSIQTPHSVLAHTLTASLYPSAPSSQPLSKSLTVHTRRYTSHSSILPLSPETYHLNDPTRIEVQVPRTSFTSGEDIPLYVTIPPPKRETVVDQGLRLRNVQAELVRVVKVKREYDDSDRGDSDSDADIPLNVDVSEEQTLSPDAPTRGASNSANIRQPSSSKIPLSPLFLGSSYRSVIARSGASCRFHSCRPIQLRFLLHQMSVSGTPSESRSSPASSEFGRMESDAEIHISFVDTSTHRERISTIMIPVVILAPPAPLPEVSPAIDEAYQKKHDRPPVRTNRQEESEIAVPHYSEGEAGPSALSAGAPPPFDDRDAPPPFFVTEAEASSSSRLPTFQESESEVILPSNNSNSIAPLPVIQSIPGEGAIFGFTSAQQFDGHSEDMQRSSTPPPTLEMATHDSGLISLTELHDSGHVTIEVLSLLEHHDEDAMEDREPPPPPPPAMDDPSDPPPSIDSDFRSPGAMGQRTATPPLPPYLIPDNHQEHVARPPPYVD